MAQMLQKLPTEPAPGPLRAEHRRANRTRAGKFQTLERVPRVGSGRARPGVVRPDERRFDWEDVRAETEADRLKLLSSELGLTQKEIARRVGVSPVVINRIFKNPDRSSVATLRKIAKAMGVKLIELLDG